MSQKEKELLTHLLDSIKAGEASIKATKKWAEKLREKMGISANEVSVDEKTEDEVLEIAKDSKDIEGCFDGENMIDKDGEVYSVPANYASKSKLVEGDRLKLSIASNGAFIYKQLDLVPRKLVVGCLVVEGSQYQVLVNTKAYNVLYSAVTFHRAKVGDQVSVTIPDKKRNVRFAAIENVIPEKIVRKSLK